MIKKKILLERIQKLIDLEKSLIPILNKHVAASMGQSGIKKEDVDRVVQNFKRFSVIQSQHVEILSAIRDDISKGSSDVY